MRTFVAVLVTVVAGGCTYKPGSFTNPARRFVGQRATVGCLDLAVDRRADMEQSAVLDYTFGNRCDKPVRVDLVRVPVIGRTSDGEEVKLVPYDPDGEMRSLELDARLAGGEAIAYPATRPLVQVCVDVAAIVGAEPARWLCFARTAHPADEPVDAVIAARPTNLEDDRPPGDDGAALEEVTP